MNPSPPSEKKAGHLRSTDAHTKIKTASHNTRSSAKRQVRKPSRELLYRIALQHTPKNLQFIRILDGPIDDAEGFAWGSRRFIAVPRPDTLKALWVYVHEVYHVKFHTGKTNIFNAVGDFVRNEFEAERYARNVFRKHGISTAELEVRSCEYISDQVILKAAGCGGWYPDETICDYCDHPDYEYEPVDVYVGARFTYDAYWKELMDRVAIDFGSNFDQENIEMQGAMHRLHLSEVRRVFVDSVDRIGREIVGSKFTDDQRCGQEGQTRGTNSD